jgi:hypothetical protein
MMKSDRGHCPRSSSEESGHDNDAAQQNLRLSMASCDFAHYFHDSAIIHTQRGRETQFFHGRYVAIMELVHKKGHTEALPLTDLDVVLTHNFI